MMPLLLNRFLYSPKKLKNFWLSKALEIQKYVKAFFFSFENTSICVTESKRILKDFKRYMYIFYLNMSVSKLKMMIIIENVEDNCCEFWSLRLTHRGSYSLRKFHSKRAKFVAFSVMASPKVFTSKTEKIEEKIPKIF